MAEPAINVYPEVMTGNPCFRGCHGPANRQAPGSGVPFVLQM